MLEALETVGEAEMLRKLEESILAGTVPACAGSSSSDSCSASSTPQPILPPKPPPKPTMAPPFPLTNTILRHPYSNPTRTTATQATYSSIGQQADGRSPASGGQGKDASGSILTPMTMSLSSSFGANPGAASTCPTSRPLSISTIFSGYEHIPFITTPVPTTNVSTAPKTLPSTCSTAAPSTSGVATTSNTQAAGTVTRVDRSNSPASSSIQLSGSATPSAEAAVLDPRDAAAASTASTSARASTSGMFPSNAGASRVPLEIYRISLTKDKMYNDFGFSVSDGVQDKGVYINKIRTGGPADVSGNVKPFDRILQVRTASSFL